MRNHSKQYFAFLDELAGERARTYEMTAPSEANPVFVAVYNNIPDDGHITAFTFGLSSVVHPDWNNSRPELMISVRSNDDAWALCMGEIISAYRGTIPFSYGSILHFRQRIVDDCPMTSFLVFASSLLSAAQQTISLPDRLISISQIYPIYEEESALIHQVGVERFFWEFDINFSDLSRPPSTPPCKTHSST